MILGNEKQHIVSPRRKRMQPQEFLRERREYRGVERNGTVSASQNQRDGSCLWCYLPPETLVLLDT